MFAKAANNSESHAATRKITQRTFSTTFTSPCSSSFTQSTLSQQSKALKPSPPSIYNSNIRKPYQNTTKSTNANYHTTASSIPGGNQSATDKPARTATKIVKKAGVTMNVLEVLHDDTGWDENDFVDDAEIDLDEPDEPIVFRRPSRLPDSSATSAVNYPSLHNRGKLKEKEVATSPTAQYGPVSALETFPPSDISYPVLPDSYPVLDSGAALAKDSAPTVSNLKTVEEVHTSSIPIPWSSSPQSHYERPAQKRLSDSGANEEVQAEQATTKRRKLPWATKMESRTPATPVPAKKPRGRPKRSTVKTEASDNTSDEKIRTKGNLDSPSHPWNTTPNAIKEEQAKHRQQANQSKKRSKVSRPTLPTFSLTQEQKSVRSLVVDDKKSVFFTGSAGTGKSVLMKDIIKTLRLKYAKQLDAVAVTASTGLAAFNIGGVTLHNFAGIGLGKEKVEDLIKKIGKNPKAKNRWLKTKVLVIDEISMVDGDLFDKLEQIARIVRKNGRPFGGIQLVVTGDFFQLPPVPENYKAAKFSFEAATWGTSIHNTIKLTQIFRQQDQGQSSLLVLHHLLIIFRFCG